MKTVTTTARNGIAFPEDQAINLRNIIKYYNNASTKAVVMLDVEPGGNARPVSYTLDISKATLDALIATDGFINLITASVYDLSTGLTTTTSFNEKYLVSLRDSMLFINGAVDVSVVEIVYSQGASSNKTVYANGTLAALVASNAADILAYLFLSVPGSSTIVDIAERTIIATVPAGTTVTALVATFTTSPSIASIVIGATPQVSGSTTNNFSTAKTYIVTAQDAITVRNWIASVVVDIGHLAVMLTMTHASQVGSTVIDGTAGTITMHMPSGTNVTAFVMTFTKSPNATVAIGATAQVSASTANDFTTAKTYVVTSEDGLTTKSYVATVVVDS